MTWSLLIPHLLSMTHSRLPFLPAISDTLFPTIPPFSLRCSWPSPRYVITYHYYLLSSRPRPLPALYDIFLNTNPTCSPWHVPDHDPSLLSRHVPAYCFLPAPLASAPRRLPAQLSTNGKAGNGQAPGLDTAWDRDCRCHFESGKGL